MAKRTYTQIVASIETQIIYVETHLRNIDSHLEKLNTSQGKQDLQIGRNKNNIGWVIKLGGVIIVLILIPLFLKMFGVY